MINKYMSFRSGIKILITLLLNLFLGLLIIYNFNFLDLQVVAQDLNEIEEVTDEALKLKITNLEQDYPERKVGFRLEIDSEVDSGTTTIEWFYDSKYLIPQSPTKYSITVVKGKTAYTEVYFKPYLPKELGSVDDLFTVDVGAKVTAVTFEKNVFSVIKKVFIFDGYYQILPVTDQYRQIKTEYEINNYIYFLGTIGIITLILSFALGKFLNYLNSEDEVFEISNGAK